MSKSVSAMPDAVFEGSVQVQDAGLRGMITLRGDLGSARLGKAVQGLGGLEIPARGKIALKGQRGVAWMSPDELLILSPYNSAAKDADALLAALAGSHHLLANVSDARAVFRVTGPGLRDVLAKLTPADMSLAGFKAGQIRRTRLGQVGAAFWFSAKDQVDVVCFRSVASYMFEALKTAAHPKAEVDFHS